MKKILYNKLVRNRIPELIESKFEFPEYIILDDESYERMLEEKLDEEVREYHQDKTIEELADILEVVIALCESRGFSKEELIKIYQNKHQEKGGFSDKIYLVSKTIKEES
ncbi:MAG: nucleoside triphosphate pyrophosphohydrolase [Erysipelotrichaceae bacterium]|nr:nucleoside triphosphate pyrophosphohydrolase [Erysipelotrichaceae bacterium]